MKEFKNSRTFRKSNNELSIAINKPHEAKRMLARAHNYGNIKEGDDPQMRLMGDIEKVMDLVTELGLEEYVDGVYKNFRDKEKREKIDPANVRVYLNIT